MSFIYLHQKWKPSLATVTIIARIQSCQCTPQGRRQRVFLWRWWAHFNWLQWSVIMRIPWWCEHNYETLWVYSFALRFFATGMRHPSNGIHGTPAENCHRSCCFGTAAIAYVTPVALRILLHSNPTVVQYKSTLILTLVCYWDDQLQQFTNCRTTESLGM